jgi:prevent-host-death family protein
VRSLRYDHNNYMRQAGITELKARLSEYLDPVKAGCEILITDRGVPVARLVPLEQRKQRGSRRLRLARAGIEFRDFFFFLASF